MSKPPKLVIPGLNRGAGIPPGYVMGRLPGSGHGPAQLLNLNDLRRVGLATAAGTTQSTSLAVSTATSLVGSLSASVSTSISSIISTDTAQSTSLSQISSSLSGAISSTTSLSTAVSTVISGSISTVNSRIDSLSAAGGGGYTDEQAQDAVGTILSNTATINLTYDDPTPKIYADVNNDSITYTKFQNAAAGNVVLTRANSASGDYGETALAASQLLGRGSTGDVAAITLDSSLLMSTTTLSVNTSIVGGFKTLATTYADVGNVTTTETDIFTFTTAAGELGANGDRLEAQYAGVFVSSGTATRQLKVYFGGTAIFDSGALTISLAAAWDVTCTITRVSGTVIRYAVSMTTEGAALAAYTATGELTGLTLSNTNIIKLTGTAAGVGAASNDIVGKASYVDKHPFNSSSTVAMLPLSLANGGTGVTLVDPNADRIAFWDDSAGAMTWLSLDPGLEISGTTLRTARGTSFPGSPASGDQFLRTDRNIEYFYDGTRWLSTTLYHGMIGAAPAAAQPTGTAFNPLSYWINPHGTTYDIYIEIIRHHAIMSGTGNWTITVTDNSGAAVSTVSNITASDFTSATINATSANYRQLRAGTTENSGTATLNYYPSFSYRLVG